MPVGLPASHGRPMLTLRPGAVVKFRILGPLEVHGCGAPAHLGGAKQVALLATLILHSNQPTSVAELIDSTWADSPPAAAMATVHTYVSRLRRAFDAVEAGAGKRIVTRPNAYLLRVEPDELDADVFREHVRRGRQAADTGQFDQAATELSAGLRLWRGPALADVASEVLRRNEVPRLAEERLRALEQRIAADLELGRHCDVVGELRALTEENPLREQLWSQLMLALYRSNRQGEALAVYQRVRALHVQEMGIDPGPELQRLHAAILANAPSLAAPSSTAPAPSQPVPPTIPAPSQLPADVVGLVGREPLVTHVCALLSPRAERNSAPLVVFSGLPGIGKTALATHIAHQLRPQFPDGQLYVNLRGYTLAEPVTATSVLARFLRALGLPPNLVPIDLDEQVALYRSLLADKQVLVVLDNANAAEHVRPLLPAGPHCAVLVTSRSALSGLTALEGATRFTLGVLAPTDALRLLGNLVGDARVIVEPAANELAELCGYLPLALRVAAANLSSHPHLSLSQYVADLRAGNRLAALVVEGDEQTGVRAAFDVSYAALSPEGARLFRYLSLVPGPDFTAYAAAALIDINLDRAQQLLGHLGAANLIQDSGPDRYHFHDLLRHYALQRGESEDLPPERERAVERLYSYYFQATCAASAIIEPVRATPEPPAHLPAVPRPTLADRPAAMVWLEHEDRNLQAAVNHAAERGPAPFAWHLADAMTAPLALTARFVEWVSVTQTGLCVAVRYGDKPGEAIMRNSLGHAYNTTGHMELAINELSQGLVLYQLLDRPLYQIPCHYALGTSYLWTGRLDKAVEHLNSTLELSTRLEFLHYQTNALHGLGIARRYLGEVPTALERLTRCLEIDAAHSGGYGQATWRFSLGLTYRDLGCFDDAIEQLTETLRTYEQLNSTFGISRSLVGLASCYLEMGKLENAVAAARRGLSLSRKIKHSRIEVDALNVLAGISENLDNLAEAHQHHEAALTVAEGMGPYMYGWIEAQIGLASVSRQLRQLAAAQRHANAALASIGSSGFRLHEGKALLVLAHIEHDIRELNAAFEHCHSALAVCRKTGQRAVEARARQLLDQIERSAAGQLRWPLGDSSVRE